MFGQNRAEPLNIAGFTLIKDSVNTSLDAACPRSVCLSFELVTNTLYFSRPDMLIYILNQTKTKKMK